MGYLRADMTEAAVSAEEKKGKPRWISKREAANRVGVSTDTIERRAIPRQDRPVMFKLRYKLLQLGPQSDGSGAAFLSSPTSEASLYDPPPRAQVVASGPLRRRNRILAARNLTSQLFAFGLRLVAWSTPATSLRCSSHVLHAGLSLDGSQLIFGPSPSIQFWRRTVNVAQRSSARFMSNLGSDLVVRDTPRPTELHVKRSHAMAGDLHIQLF